MGVRPPPNTKLMKLVEELEAEIKVEQKAVEQCDDALRELETDRDPYRTRPPLPLTEEQRDRLLIAIALALLNRSTVSGNEALRDALKACGVFAPLLQKQPAEPPMSVGPPWSGGMPRVDKGDPVWAYLVIAGVVVVVAALLVYFLR